MNYISVFKEVWFLENSLQCMKYFFAFKIKINWDFRKFYMVRSLFLLLENLFSVYGVILCWFLLYMIFQTIIQGLILLRNYSILVFEEFKNQSSVVFLNLKKGWILQVHLMNFYPVIRDSIMLIPTCESCANSIFLKFCKYSHNFNLSI